MNNKKGPLVTTDKIKGIKARSAKAVSKYLEALFAELESDKSLLNVIQSKVRLAVPEAYKQLSLNAPIKRRLQELEKVKPISSGLTILNPTDFAEPADIHAYREGRYNTTAIEFTTSVTIDGRELKKGTCYRVTRVERRNGILHLANVTDNKDRHIIPITSPAYLKAAKTAVFYYESEMAFSEGDIISELDSPDTLQQITNISLKERITEGRDGKEIVVNYKELSLINVNGKIKTLSSEDLASRKITLAYALSGERALRLKAKHSIILLDGDDKTPDVKEFIKAITNNTSERLYVCGVEKNYRKSVQIICPIEMMAKVEQAVQQKKTTHRGYLEGLIEEFLATMESSPGASESFMVLYSSPPFSKANAFWVSEGHYELLKSFCDEYGFKVNPLAHHLVFRDLVRRNLITLDDRLLPQYSDTD
tara:strand:- start:10301 stop:11566 length:1266 start_codon:yes stop_codon:yes gene_type:complete